MSPSGTDTRFCFTQKRGPGTAVPETLWPGGATGNEAREAGEVGPAVGVTGVSAIDLPQDSKM